jgi:RecA/RadA recombinase
MDKEINISLGSNTDKEESKTVSLNKEAELINEAAKSATITLTQDEVEKIAKNKKDIESKKRKINTVVVQDDWKDSNLSEDELKLAETLSRDILDFLIQKTETKESSGVIETIPTGVDLLDVVLGGGVGVGTVSLFAGNPGTFKSAIAGQILANSQKKFRGKVTNHYLDTESAMTVKRLMSLGVKYPPIKPLDDISVERVFKVLEAIISFKEMKNSVDIPSVVVWDSVANTTTEIEKKDSTLDINKVIGLRARILSTLIPRYISRLRDYNISLIAINQLRDKMEMGQFAPAADLKWMGEKTMPGGNALKFNAFHLVLLKAKADLDPKKFGFNGIILEAKAIKNKLFSPNVPIQMVVDFNRGVSNFYTNYNLLIENDIIKSAAWQEMTGYDARFRTHEAEDLYNDPKNGFRKVFDEHVKNILKLITDKYQNIDPIKAAQENDEE